MGYRLVGLCENAFNYLLVSWVQLFQNIFVRILLDAYSDDLTNECGSDELKNGNVAILPAVTF